jgi:hypothetical protein
MNNKHIAPVFQRSLLVACNASATRKALQGHLFSQEFLLGLIWWTVSAGVVLWEVWTKSAFPRPLMAGTVLFFLFTGCCWVLLPILVALERSLEHGSRQSILASPWLPVLTGVQLWHQAAQGFLSRPFGVALLVGIGLWFATFRWALPQPWSAWFGVAFFVNAAFYLVFPFFIFLEARVMLPGRSQSVSQKQGR